MSLKRSVIDTNTLSKKCKPDIQMDIKNEHEIHTEEEGATAGPVMMKESKPLMKEASVQIEDVLEEDPVQKMETLVEQEIKEEATSDLKEETSGIKEGTSSTENSSPPKADICYSCAIQDEISAIMKKISEQQVEPLRVDKACQTDPINKYNNPFQMPYSLNKKMPAPAQQVITPKKMVLGMKLAMAVVVRHYLRGSKLGDISPAEEIKMINELYKNLKSNEPGEAGGQSSSVKDAS